MRRICSALSRKYLVGTLKNCPDGLLRYEGAAFGCLGRDAAQLGFFDFSHRYASLDAKKNPLVEIDVVVA